LYKELVLQEVNYYYAHLNSMTHGNTMSTRQGWRYNRNIKRYQNAATHDTATIYKAYWL